MMLSRIAFAAAFASLSICAVPAYAAASASSAFLSAVRDGDGDKVTAELAKTATARTIINTRDPSTGETALHIVAKRRNLTWLNFLLQKDADPNIRDNSGSTPLMIATQLSWGEGIELLLGRRASIDLANNLGETPLIRAVLNRDLATVRLLLLNGADPARHDIGAGLSARDYAKRDPRASLILREIDSTHPRPKTSVGPN